MLVAGLATWPDPRFDLDVMEPDDGVAGIGSGGPAAVAAARALVKHSSLKTKDIVREALQIAAGLDIYTNERLHVEEL